MEADFYTKSIQFYYSTKKLTQYEIQELNHPFLKEIPKHLYKYRKSGEEGRASFYIDERKIYTASFNDLNDIFEGITPATKDRILNSTAEKICNHYKEAIISILANRFPGLNVESANNIFEMFSEEHFDNDSIYSRAKSLVSEEQQKELRAVLSAISYIFRQLDSEMDKNGEFAKGMQLLMNTNSLMGAFCMCESYTQENLWAFYADDFKGYCIEYNLTNPCRSKGSIRFIQGLYPVNYVDKKDDDWFKPLFESTVATINIDGKGDKFNSGLIFNHWMTKTLCSKKKQRWSTENEWRFIGKANGKQLGPLISTIIVGHKINKKDFDIIQTYAKKRDYPLKITAINYEKQEVFIRDLTPMDIEEINKRT